MGRAKKKLNGAALHRALREAVERVTAEAGNNRLKPLSLGPKLHQTLKVDQLLPELKSDQLVFLERAPTHELAREHKNIALWLSINTGSERVIFPVHDDCSVPTYETLPVSAAA